ncbi:MAG TPA: hypothetical protein VF762_17425 [Blastocatellia bacterium]|jgi:hypothetical protein
MGKSDPVEKTAEESSTMEVRRNIVDFLYEHSEEIGEETLQNVYKMLNDSVKQEKSS